LKELVDPIFNRVDHNCLNEILDNPTAENIVDYLVEEVKKVLGRYSEHKYLRLVGLRVWETPDAYVEWREG
jgi:6-pyruvoyl-tetrahydropterin synthase